MSPPRDRATTLLRLARSDQWFVEHLVDAADAPDSGLAFHAQQAVEKAIKAVLAHKSVDYPYTHNLAFLIQLLRDSGLDAPPDGEGLVVLVPFGAALRYDEVPSDTPMTFPDRRWMRDAVKRTLAWAEKVVLG